jgi:hypothetical protein
MPTFSFTVGSLGDILSAAGLAIRIIQTLYAYGDPSGEHLALTFELQSLNEALILTKDALRRYEKTPLGSNLDNTIHPIVAQCHTLMQNFLGKLEGCRQPLSTTGISGLWRKVLWAAGEVSEVEMLRTKLCAQRGTLAIFLLALNSYVN